MGGKIKAIKRIKSLIDVCAMHGKLHYSTSAGNVKTIIHAAACRRGASGDVVSFKATMQFVFVNL